MLFPLGEADANRGARRCPSIEIDTPAAPAYIRWDRRIEE